MFNNKIMQTQYEYVNKDTNFNMRVNKNNI
jgi:hypothetical protein